MLDIALPHGIIFSESVHFTFVFPVDCLHH